MSMVSAAGTASARIQRGLCSMTRVPESSRCAFTVVDSGVLCGGFGRSGPWWRAGGDCCENAARVWSGVGEGSAWLLRGVLRAGAEAVCEGVGESACGHFVECGVDVVGDAVGADVEVVGVEHGPGGVGVAVSWLADGSGVDDGDAGVFEGM